MLEASELFFFVALLYIGLVPFELEGAEKPATRHEQGRS
jgi:hypothetical protein